MKQLILPIFLIVLQPVCIHAQGDRFVCDESCDPGSSQGEINADANTAISRFMSLALQNLAGYYVGQNRMGTFGYIQPWCLVEDEEACQRLGRRPSHGLYIQQGEKKFTR